MRPEGEFDRKLVSYVERHPCLYDRTDPDYRGEESTQQAWRQIAQDMEASACEVKSRWKDLKKSFGKAYREFATLAPACTSHPRSCIAFPFFESMLWLAPYLRRRRNGSETFKIRKCPVHGFVSEQLTSNVTKKSESLRKKQLRKESVSSETTIQSPSSYFTESSTENDSCMLNKSQKRNSHNCNDHTSKTEKKNTHSVETKIIQDNINNINPEEDKSKMPDEGYLNAPENLETEKDNVPNIILLDRIEKKLLNTSKGSANVQTQTEYTSIEKEIDENIEGSRTIPSYQGFMNADINFMLSVLSDMQSIPYKGKIKFKSEVMQLIEKYVLSENP